MRQRQERFGPPLLLSCHKKRIWEMLQKHIGSSDSSYMIFNQHGKQLLNSLSETRKELKKSKTHKMPQEKIVYNDLDCL